jgi:hypothetical protein
MDDNNKSGQDYEFNDGENKIISELASAMNFIGVVIIVLGVITSIIGLMELGTPNNAGKGIISLLQAVLYTVIGTMTMGVAGHFSQVVKTEGNDINFLMQALDKLRGMYVLQKIVIIITIVLLVVAFVLFIPRR